MCQNQPRKATLDTISINWCPLCGNIFFIKILERQVYLDVLKETQPLSMMEIEAVFHASDEYVVPYHKQNAKCYGLILYNTNDRINSTEEAKVVETNLQNADFQTRRVMWESALKLPHILHEQLTGHTDQMSLLMVCIMSHGRIGTLTGTQSSVMPISDVLWKLSELLPEHLPLVGIIPKG